jgi:cyclohexanecarboxylate-CoA ligase/acyl-CoA synthetase
MLSNARGSAAELGLGPGDVLCSAAPLSHLYGLFTAHLALATGAASLLLPAFTPADLAGLVERGRPSAVFAGPAHLAACLGAGLFERHDFSSVRTLVISGSACPPELAEAVEARLPRGKVLQLWGMTELQAGAFNRPGDEARRRWASAGRASPGTELRVRGDDATAAPPGVEGELEVRGCSVFAGYYDNAEATSTAFTADGWFRTGDLAVLDAEGYLQLTGRVKEVINRGGVKWNPADVEALIGRMPGVAQCAIVAVPDPVLGERACCFAVPEAGATVTLDAIRAHLEDHHVAKYKWPEQLELVAEMPLTPTRKVIKRLLRPAAR